MTLIKLLVEGGNMSPGPAVAQTLGPMGINMGQVISDVNSATGEFKGITVPVHIEVNSKTKEFSIKVLSPPTSELIKKELGIEKASGERLKQRVGNLAIEQLISISKAKHDSLLSNEFISTVKSVVGTCQALGVLIENKEASEIQNEIAEGKYSDEISAKKTEVDPEKKKELEEYFKNVELEQEAVRKAEEEEKAAEEEKKAAESIEVAPEEKGEEKEEEKEE
jgi:large subunit ribosomal protein L11|tara:strand:- start:517 stop:1185 length:669 start_codon:yes stop_codon:yes gene_type:complete